MFAKLALIAAAIAAVEALPSAVPAVAKMRKLNDGLLCVAFLFQSSSELPFSGSTWIRLASLLSAPLGACAQDAERQSGDCKFIISVCRRCLVCYVRWWWRCSHARCC
jgi:hypothetical protein